MDHAALFLAGLWSGLFAIALGLLLTAPVRYLLPTFVCGFAGRFCHDLLADLGMSRDWATVAASILVVLIAAVIIRHRQVSPVVLICAILPLGSALAIFNSIFYLMRISTLEGDDLASASVALNANLGKAFTGTLAIAVGVAAGLGLIRLFVNERDAISDA